MSCNISPSKKNTEGFEDRNVTSAICRSTPNGLNELNKKINDCTATTELSRNNKFGETAFKLQQDIEMSRAVVGDSLVMGDAVFGKFGVADITQQVKLRNEELKKKKENLRSIIDKNEAIIERSARDFSDVKNTLPEQQEKKVLNFIEDYTLAFLVIAYLFMIIAIIYVYTITSDLKLVAFGKAFITSIFVTIFLYILLQYLT